ncbi:DUF6531 domain-containing protein, partial [Sphingobacterium sp. MYb382]|uniref:DUF6531 domain-containing protein n=1 Tax=Sphingobacterium sp. MYb382 TaxID=2745278 RepID=UPI0030A9702A
PVDAATGRVYSSNIDVELAGPLPFVWERTYYSDAEVKGPMGYNWHHSYHMGLFNLGNGYAFLRLSDGREMPVPLLGFGESWYSREEQMTFSKDEEGYLLVDADKLHYRFDGPKNREGYVMLSQIATKEGFNIDLRYNSLGDLLEITDSRDQLIQVDTDAQGRITKLHTQGEQQKSVTLVAYTYDELGNMTSVKDIAVAQKHFYYAGHLLVKLTNQTGQSFHWEYEGHGDEAKCIHTWGDGGILDYWTVYNDGHTITRNSLGHTAHYFYDEKHLIYKIIDENGGITHQYYNPYQELELSVDGEGLTQKFEYNSHGKLTKVENGGITSYEYDDRLNLTRIISPGRKSITWKYDTLDRVIEKKNAAGGTLYYTYEGQHIRTVSDEQGNTYELYFDRRHQLVQMTHPTKLLSFWQYDSRGNVLLEQDVQGMLTKYEYDDANNLIYIRESGGNEHYLKYDSSRNIIHAKDDYREVKFRYGSLGILLERTQNGRSVGFSYDTELQLKSIRNEGGERYRFGLDAMGNVVSEWGFDGLQRRYQRDANGRVKKVMRSEDRWSRYEYDASDHIVLEEHSDKTWAAYKYDKDGLLISALNEDTHLQLQRDRAGRVIKETQGAYSISRSYDKWGNATQISSSLGADIQLDHDSQGLITQMQSGDWEAKWAYNKRGMEIQRELSGGVRVETVRDSYGRVCSRSIGVNNIEQASHRYTWKQGNRLQSIINRLGETTSFEYDEWDNLVSGQYSNGKEMNTIYKAPDAIGNLFKTPERNDRSYDAGGSLIKDETYHYHYDDEGNLVFKEFIQVGYPALFERRVLEKMLNIKIKASGKGTVYEWAGNGMLKSVVHPLGYKVSFYYDALGRRIAKKKNSIVTRWLWDGNVPLHEWQYEGVYPPELSVDESKQLQQEAEPVENLITWLFEENSFVPCGKIVGKETYSIVSDYLGTPNFMYNAQGEKVWECTLDIYGKVRTLQGSLKDCPFRYQGQYDDVEIGLYYNRFRYYSPDIGGYISKDPIGLAGNNPTLYGYVGDTNTWIDPFGLDPLVSVQEKINNILLDHLSAIQKIDSNASIGYRGSAASGISKAHDPSISKPLNPNNFDVDAFINSDYLANNPLFTNRTRNAAKIDGMKEIEASIDKQLREVFPNNKFKNESFGFRIFKTHELDELARKGDSQFRLNCH